MYSEMTMTKIVEHTIIMSLQSNEAKKHRQIKDSGTGASKWEWKRERAECRTPSTTMRFRANVNVSVCVCGGALVKLYVTQQY